MQDSKAKILSVLQSCTVDAQYILNSKVKLKILFFFLRFYLFIHERHRERQREAETQAKGETSFLQGALCGTWSQDPRITTWAKDSHSTTEPPRWPKVTNSKVLSYRMITLKMKILIPSPVNKSLLRCLPRILLVVLFFFLFLWFWSITSFSFSWEFVAVRDPKKPLIT